MKAIQFETYGDSDVLHAVDLPEPHPAAGQVRIRVKTVGVNPMEVKIRSGAMKDFMPLKLPSVPGMELAGTVDEVGPGVTAFKVGDEVFGWSESGAYAEYAIATQIAQKPSGLAWDVAAAIPVAADTSSRVLDLLGVTKGDTLLVHGGAGAVGAVAVQLAVQRGARVIATASADDQAYVRSLGATPVTYGDGLVTRISELGLPARPGAPHGIDAVLDTAGKGALPDSIALRGDTSRIITIADMGAQALDIPFSAGQPSDRKPARVREVGELVASGAIKMAIAARFPLAEAKQAQEALGARGRVGKIVLALD